MTLTVFAVDSTSGKPIAGTLVSVRAPGWYVSETHHEPDWSEETDTEGRARLRKIPSGAYEVHLCNDNYERRTLTLVLGSRSSETLHARLWYLGPPPDGRRCETIFKLPKSLENDFKKHSKSVRN